MFLSRRPFGVCVWCVSVSRISSDDCISNGCYVINVDLQEEQVCCFWRETCRSYFPGREESRRSPHPPSLKWSVWGRARERITGHWPQPCCCCCCDTGWFVSYTPLFWSSAMPLTPSDHSATCWAGWLVPIGFKEKSHSNVVYKYFSWALVKRTWLRTRERHHNVSYVYLFELISDIC